MYLPFLALFVPYWTGAVSADTMLTGGQRSRTADVPCGWGRRGGSHAAGLPAYEAGGGKSG
jgi:hypothetical protein